MDALLLILDTVRTSPRAPAMATMAARRCCLRYIHVRLKAAMAVERMRSVSITTSIAMPL